MSNEKIYKKNNYINTCFCAGAGASPRRGKKERRRESEEKRGRCGAAFI